jgi:hypothetical protein
MKLAVIGAGKWGLNIIERYLSKAHLAALTLSLLQQQAQAASCSVRKYGGTSL